MASNFYASKPLNCWQRKRVRRCERETVRGQVYRCFCEGRGIPESLLRQAVLADIFAGRPVMNDEQAVNYVLASADLSRKEQRKNRLFFQAWFVVGSKNLWSLVRIKISSAGYHQTARRCGKREHVASCPQVSCRL